MKIGLVSDTHNHLDPLLCSLFAGVDYILHAGDIGESLVISRLERIAPVTAVLGNNDFDIRLREFESLVLAGHRFLLHHIVDPRRPSEAVRRRLEQDKPDVVVFGHTHRALSETLDGTLFINPGYAGRPRFGHARSAAILHYVEGELKPEFIVL
jgi:uncharacterized protein